MLLTIVLACVESRVIGADDVDSTIEHRHKLLPNTTIKTAANNSNSELKIRGHRCLNNVILYITLICCKLVLVLT